MSRKFAFVLPRYFDSIAGGAETLSGNLARNIKLAGDDVEIWTTCAKDHRTWDNFFPESYDTSGTVPVRRFLVSPRDLDLWAKREIEMSQGIHLPLEAQLEWLQNGVNSDDLYRHILLNGESFDAIFFAPYLFATSIQGSLIHPHKSILIPCLHNEAYAYLEIVSHMFRTVRGCLFNAAPEMALANSFYGEILGGPVGMGFDLNDNSGLTPYFGDSFPYCLYLGRKETGKGVNLLLDFFVRAKEEHPELERLKLVVCGGGDFSDLKRNSYLLRNDIVDVTHVSELDKKRLLQFSLCLIQPSVMESFSIVLMEAWLLGVPAIVNSRAEVTKDHVLKSGGGLLFSDYEDFTGVLQTLYSDAELVRTLGDYGKRYVSAEYNWQSVLKRFNLALENIYENSMHEARSC